MTEEANEVPIAPEVPSTFINTFLSSIASICVVVFIITLNGYITLQYWNWFIIPLGVIQITLLHAIGLAYFIYFLTYKHDSKREKKKKDISYVANMCVKVGVKLLFLLTGFIIFKFM